MSTTLHRDWLRLVIEADGMSDYRNVAVRRLRADWLGRTLSFVSTAIVGFIVVSAAVGVAASRPQVTAAADELRSRVQAAQSRAALAEQQYLQARQQLLRTQDAVRPDLDGALAAALDSQGIAAAYVPMRGPGVVVTLDDAKRPTFSGTTDLGRVIDRDVQHVVNGLWQAGAEAISINGVRLTARTSIRNAGAAILVDYKPVSTPLRIVALGGPVAMDRDFRAQPEWQELRQLADRYRIQWSFNTREALSVPAGASSLPNLANPVGGS